MIIHRKNEVELMIYPQISVIIPVYNAEKRLELSIDSILSQTYKNIELILINDGSTDSSPKICDKYSELDGRVKVIHQQNTRVSAARNRGIKEAKGKYISFIDSDDLISSETYEEIMKHMLDDSIDIVIFGMVFEYYKENVVVKSRIKSIEQDMCFDVENIKDCFFYLLDKNYLTSACNKVIKTSIIKENKILFEKEMSELEDFKFVLDVLENSQKVCAISYPFYKYYNDLQFLSLKRRPNIDYIKNFQILDKKLRNFSGKFALDKGLESEKINGLIMRYYIIAIEKLFTGSASFKCKYTEMKEIITFKDFEKSLYKAYITGLRLKIVYYLLKKRKFKTLFLLFSFNDFVKNTRKWYY